MRKATLVLAGLLLAGVAHADSLVGVNKFVCAASQVQICLEGDSCYSASPWELGVPEFVVIDLQKQSISTTKSSEGKRSTTFSKPVEEDGKIYFQGFEGGRAFSFVIHEASGLMSVAVARDGLVVSVFGACTDTNL